MRAISLAIVGAGPSCTYVMERLAATARGASLDIELDIHVFDRSGQFGAGQVHSPAQPRTSFLNRIVGQVAFAADETVQDAGPLLERALRPTLHEWCAAKYAETGRPEFALGPEDWPKRYVHGLALREQFERYVALLNAVPGVRVHLHTTEVVDLVEAGARLAVVSSDGEQWVVADQVLLLTGHSWNRPERFVRQARWDRFATTHAAVFVPCAYPLEHYLTEEIAPAGETVACAGMGLTAIDVVLHLTEGRGGVFKVSAEGRLTYQPSGREPACIALFSSAGLFTYARPHNAKERDLATLEHRGVFLTEAAIDQLRTTVGKPVSINGRTRRQLDFERHVMPLVVLEMAYLYYATLLGAPFAAILRAAAEAEYSAFLDDGGGNDGPDRSMRRLLGPVDSAVDRAEQLIEQVLAGRPSPLYEEGWAAGAVYRYVEVVYGSETADRLAGQLAAGRGIGSEVSGLTSPARHGLCFADNRFSWQRMIQPLPVMRYAGPSAYTEALLDFMTRDHLWAAQDNLTNPAKAAADGVWRDLRQVLAYAVDFGGLTASSHRDFLDTYLRHHNRLCNGAALEVMEKMRAVIEHGVVDVSFGPGAVAIGDEATGLFRVTGPNTGSSRLVHTLVDARVHQFDAEADVQPLYPNLLRRGLVRKWRNPGVHEPDFEPGGLDLTAEFHPVRADGTSDGRLTILGPPSEGVMFFQLGALRPNQNHHVMQDVLCWVRHFWQVVADAHEPRPLVTSPGHGQSS